MLGATALLYLYNLGASGWANGFYAAAVQAGTRDGVALLFGSSDAANAITVDKTPGALWVMGVSARLFGFNPWSMLVPQALMGVTAVAVLYAAVRRVSGPRAALLAGAALAITPAAALMFRFNNPDALLVLMLVVSAYCVLRALDGARWWLPAAGAALGVAFLAKMLQALLVAPGLAAVFLLCADLPLRSRVLRTLGGAAALAVCSGWYLALVTLWPAASRPYIGGSQHNSILELALGYNGLGRLTGDEVGGLGNLDHDVGWARLLGGQMGTQIGWLLPAAVIAIGAGLVITRRAPRTDPTRAALLLWGGWLLVTGAVFSYMNGIVHPYYTVALAPAVAAGLATGLPLLWHRRTDIRAATTLCALVLITAGLGFVLLQRHPDWLPWLRWSVLVLGAGTGLVLLVAGRSAPRIAAAAGGAALAAMLAAPLAYSVATAATPHTGAIPSAGPTTGFGGPPGLLSTSTPGPALTAALRDGAGDYTWAAATVGSNNAAGYQLAGGAPVMAVGGFNGTDPAPTPEQFRAYVAAGRIHYFIDADMMGPMRAPASGSDAAQRIRAWVTANFAATTFDGVTVYDLTERVTADA
ncbi:glycosyltransferase family 39 protein [Mycolicibacterium palauense]|uniref:glycosyltransferase family 39 protein n=1 Tax=Mycolicibacterium palauense TaxID=2034511 RepID=UPI000BFF106A|nr:glycosyltransferase family 39 protein [Mycolicibacterium palauense]